MEVEGGVEDYSGDYAGVRALPHAGEAERAVLALVLRDNNHLDEMDARLVRDDFYESGHAAIYGQVLRLVGEGKKADHVTVGNALADAGELDLAGGKDYLIDLDSLADITSNFAEYVKVVRDKSTLRTLMARTETIRSMAHRPGEASCDKILDEAERLVFAVSDGYRGAQRDVMRKIADEVPRISARVDELYDRVKDGGSPITGLRTGFYRLDMLTSGLQPSDLIILAARPSIGKTAFALDLIRNVCKGAHEGGRRPGCALFSLEMSSDQITQRMLGMEGSIDQHKLRSGRMTSSDDWDRFARAQMEIKEWPMWVDDTALLSVLELRSRVRRVKRMMEAEKVGLGMVVVDYLQLMEPDGGSRDDNRVAEVSKISRGLKTLARELKVPVIALSQLSRAIESRQVQRPQLSDLRESGAIEQDADLIMFLARANKPDDGPGGPPPKQEEIELILGKHRNGPTGTIEYGFSKEFTHFEERRDRSGYDPGDPPHRATDSGEPEDFSFHS